MYYDNLRAGDCFFPNFQVVENSYPGNRYVYVDEISNDWYFRIQLRWFFFTEDIEEDILVINGSVKGGDASQGCELITYNPRKVLVVSDQCGVRA